MQNLGLMRFKLTHRDFAMLTRYAIVGETYTVVHPITNAQLQQVRNTYKVYKTVWNFDTIQAGMYVGGNSALKFFLIVCQLCNYLILINCDRKLAMTLHTVTKSGKTISKK